MTILKSKTGEGFQISNLSKSLYLIEHGDLESLILPFDTKTVQVISMYMNLPKGNYEERIVFNQHQTLEEQIGQKNYMLIKDIEGRELLDILLAADYLWIDLLRDIIFLKILHMAFNLGDRTCGVFNKTKPLTDLEREEIIHRIVLRNC